MTSFDPPDLGIGGYEGLSEVARGGFGVVYRAREAEFDRTVAIKVLSGMLDERARMRFDRERRAMGSLSNHPNIATVYASGLTADGRPFIVMEYMDGGSLANRLEMGPVPWAETVAVGVKLARALAAAHRAGILHRDIKPENVLVSAYGEPMLADFGIARLEGGSETRSGVITASLAHAAPEILDGQRPTEAADLYSLASTLHTLITGEAPFARATDESIVPLLARIATEPAPDLRPRGVPDRVCQVLETAMAKDPTQRIGTGDDLGDQLVDAETAHGEQHATGIVTPLPHPSRPDTLIVGGPPQPGADSKSAAPAAVPPGGTPPAAPTSTPAPASNTHVPEAGWHPDPMGLWDSRWWDGSAWTDAVITGGHQDVEPLVPRSELHRLFVGEGLIWRGERRGDPTRRRTFVLTGNAVRVYKRMDRPPEEEWQVWKVASAEPRITVGQSLRGVGDVVLTIRYPGYTGRSNAVLRGVPESAKAAAVISRAARLARLLQQGSAPPT